MRRAVLAVSCLAAILLAAQALLGAEKIGLGVDDYVHALRADTWVKTGWYMPAYELAGGEPDPSRDASPYIYGAAFSALAHVVNVVLGNEGIGEVLQTADAYAVRHLLAALIGLATALCVAAAIWALTRDRLAAVWGAAALLAIPAWTGYAMFSNKDIPVAAAFTFVTVGLVLALTRADGSSWPPSRATTGIGALVAVGVLLGVGTRPAMWVPFLASLAVFAAVSWRITRSRRGTVRAVAIPAGAFALGLAGVLALHPRTATDPIKWLIESVSGSSEAGREGLYTLTAGKLLSEFPPPWYLPAWTFAAVPILILAITVIGAVVTGRGVTRLRLAADGDRGSLAVGGGMLLVAVQLLLLPTAAIVAGSATSTGLRQHLYVLPAIAILAGVGAARLIRAGPMRLGSRNVGWLPALVLCLALLVPAFEQTRLYPYNYVYISEVAGIGGVNDRWETEYQFISHREAFHRVPAGVEPHCIPWMISGEEPADTPVIESCYASLPPYAGEVGSESTARSQQGEIWAVGRRRSERTPPGYCREDDNVTRDLRGEEIVMAYVLRCDPSGLAP